MEASSFENLLAVDGTFYVTESRRLTALAVEMGLPASEIEDVIADVWLEAVKYRHCFANGEVEQPLKCWLTHVLHSKAVDKLRQLHRHPCESLDSVAEELIDESEAKRETVAELAELVDALLEHFHSTNEQTHYWVKEHFLHARSIRELAQESGTTVKSVDHRIRRLLPKLHLELVRLLGNGDHGSGNAAC